MSRRCQAVPGFLTYRDSASLDLPSQNIARILYIMTTLAEIEAAIHTLAPPEQERLLRDLERLVQGRRATPGPQAREQWMSRLENLRASIDTGGQKLSSEQILAEAREER